MLRGGQRLMALPGFFLLLASTAYPASVAQFNLAQLTDHAQRVFRGKVVDVVPGSVEAGGGRIPTLTYKFHVEEAFKGEFSTVKGITFAEIRMVGKAKSVTRGNIRSVSPFELPALSTGQSYLIFATAPSAAGLSTTVGLGQGRFEIHGSGGKETVENERGNRMLFSGMTTTARRASPEEGSMRYSDLAAQIQSLVGR
jgi:hypothetical protein